MAAISNVDSTKITKNLENTKQNFAKLGEFDRKIIYFKIYENILNSNKLRLFKYLIWHIFQFMLIL